jgi:hypothetical protein
MRHGTHIVPWCRQKTRFEISASCGRRRDRLAGVLLGNLLVMPQGGGMPLENTKLCSVRRFPRAASRMREAVPQMTQNSMSRLSCIILPIQSVGSLIAVCSNALAASHVRANRCASSRLAKLLRRLMKWERFENASSYPIKLRPKFDVTA